MKRFKKLNPKNVNPYQAGSGYRSKPRKGDKSKAFDIWFTFNGNYWVMDWIEIKKKPS